MRENTLKLHRKRSFDKFTTIPISTDHAPGDGSKGGAPPSLVIPEMLSDEENIYQHVAQLSVGVSHTKCHEPR